MSATVLWVLTIAVVMTGLWLVVRIWQSNPGGAVITFLTGLPAWYFLFKYWDDEEKDIRIPFFISLGTVIVYLVALLNSIELVKHMGSDDEVAEVKVTQAVARSSSNPEMERWCREKHDAVYDHTLGTCVEPEPGQMKAHNQASDVMDRLGSHFSENGLASSHAQVDESMPGAKNLSKLPGMLRLVQFEIQEKFAAPTVVMVGECASAQKCRDIERDLRQPNAPLSVSRNGKLMFIGFRMNGDAGKIEQAKDAFEKFQPTT